MQRGKKKQGEVERVHELEQGREKTGERKSKREKAMQFRVEGMKMRWSDTSGRRRRSIIARRKTCLGAGFAETPEGALG